MSKCQFYDMSPHNCIQINNNRIPSPGQQKYCDNDCSMACNTDKDCSNTPGPSPKPPPPNLLLTQNPPPPTTCKSFAWSKNNKVNDVEKASAFMRNAVNEYGCFKNNVVVAAEEGGMKGEGWNGSTSTLKCLCPYGMTYNEESNNEYISEIIGNNCVDVKSTVQPCKNNIMGQCLDEKETYNGKLENIYLTWFWWPNLSKLNLLNYINTQIDTCHAMALGGTNGAKCSSAPVNGLCFPLTAWPDQNNNLSFLYNDFSDDADENRKILGNWMYHNLFMNTNLKKDSHTINPGLLLYISFKDGPWVNFYPDVATNKNLINPITGLKFGNYTDWDKKTMGTGSQWVWGAFFHFMKNYVCTDENGVTRKLPKNFWLHLDKEGSQSNDQGFTQQMYTDATQYFIGNLIQDFDDGDKILYLATGVDGGGALAPKKEYFTLSPSCPDNSTNWCNKNHTSISVPEYYWGVGNQMPCDGSAGSYNYARAACTSLSSHRRLAGYPKQYVDLITGGDDPTIGSDCKKNGWLGNGDWAGATKDATKNPSIIWPSFSIENLSMCDTNNPNCYNQFTIEKNKLGKNDKSATEGLSYTGEWGENTTICNSMIWGSLLDGGTNQPLSQGMKSCGVFDGFSYWHWDDFVNFMNYFAKQYKTPNLIIYEASFIPYHWLQTLGITSDKQKTGFPNKQSALLPKPAMTDQEIGCGYYKQDGSCKAINNGVTGSYCDPQCITSCHEDNCKSYFSKQCGYKNNNWKPGPNPKPVPPGPNPKPVPPGPKPKSENLPTIIIGTIVGISLLSLIVYLLYRHFKANKSNK